MSRFCKPSNQTHPAPAEPFENVPSLLERPTLHPNSRYLPALH
ncbi:hypothetical protein VDG1235_3576 [Verrucomicrobiia bacterium DG1235]|nr:hypothetical protein VDG1235_3576 [Verrucomicrobiae bacterium DG1235]